MNRSISVVFSRQYFYHVREKEMKQKKPRNIKYCHNKNMTYVRISQKQKQIYTVFVISNQNTGTCIAHINTPHIMDLFFGARFFFSFAHSPLSLSLSLSTRIHSFIHSFTIPKNEWHSYLIYIL